MNRAACLLHHRLPVLLDNMHTGLVFQQRGLFCLSMSMSMSPSAMSLMSAVPALTVTIAMPVPVPVSNGLDKEHEDEARKEACCDANVGFKPSAEFNYLREDLDTNSTEDDACT
mmetsp:Transcript_82040/g.144907  ORF Transcript_82040/g.144907 Transcript_82040/m.144907 type:complete len:114 (-) Transcript_82040:14-355(-)